MLAVVVLYVPFLQVRFARDNRLRAFREFKQVRAAYRRAPLAFAFALWVHLLFAIPLYILKIEVIPRDLVFLEGLMFLLFIFPARLLGGWAYARGARRGVPRFWLSRWVGRFAVIPVVFAYVFVVFLSQHLGWQGVGSLYEQHAFLLPVPFVSWK
jgi:membrane protease YdiL (CAAX protease family)